MLYTASYLVGTTVVVGLRTGTSTRGTVLTTPMGSTSTFLHKVNDLNMPDTSKS